jgi:hypothetical protein
MVRRQPAPQGWVEWLRRSSKTGASIKQPPFTLSTPSPTTRGEWFLERKPFFGKKFKKIIVGEKPKNERIGHLRGMISHISWSALKFLETCTVKIKIIFVELIIEELIFNVNNAYIESK